MPRLTVLRALVEETGRDIVRDASKVYEDEVRKNINPPGGLDLTELREAGYPLHPGRHNSTAAGLDEDYQIINQEGGLDRSLGRDPLRPTANGFNTFVGFDDSGVHTGRYRPFGNPDSEPRLRSVDFNSLLNWLINGTATLVGRPILINSLSDAIPAMQDAVADLGLSPMIKSTVSKKPVIRR